MPKRPRRGAPRPPRPGFVISFPGTPKTHKLAYRSHNSATQKSTWIVGQDLLSFLQESTLGARKSPQRRFGEPQARRRETVKAGYPVRLLGSRCFIGYAPTAMSDRRGVAHDERWATPQRTLRTRGCCFVTRYPGLRHAVPQSHDALDPAGMRYFAVPAWTSRAWTGDGSKAV